MARFRFCCALLLVAAVRAAAQTFPADDPVIRRIWAEEMDSTRLPALAHQLFDVIGPRLVGSPGMMKAHEWAVETYGSWGISASNQQFGTWRGWERGVSHIDLLAPRVRTLEGTMLAFSPGTRKGGVTARLVILADCPDSASFQKWLPEVRGRFVLVSQPQPTGRPDKSWEEFATKESFDSLKALRERIRINWEHRLTAACVKADSLPLVLEEAGAAGIISSLWSTGWGTFRVFDTRATKVPAVALSLEDYNLLYRLAEHGDDARVRIEAEAKNLGRKPTYNTVATVPGTAVPGEYVMLSAHLDSWDASSGATDNGTGTIVMMEAMRVLRKCYPSPRRTILAGHWGSEEQGLNGSRAFVLDHPEIVAHLQALFNQDNGTGRVQTMSGAGFIDAPERLAHWLSRVPHEVTQNIRMDFPGMPAGGGTDHASFDAAGSPGFGLGSQHWDYFAYTWHTNRDTYDKLVFDELKNNVILAACLAYCASEDTVAVSRLRRVMPSDAKTGKLQEWPAVKEPKRDGGMNDLKEQ